MSVSISFKLDCCQKLFPLRTKIEKDFDGINYLWKVTAIQPKAKTYIVFYEEDEIEEELLH